jgi:hypothetical protein
VTDEEFTQAFETCEIPNAAFRHRDHIRLAWIYLRKYGPTEAATRISVSIRRFAAHNGASHKYHETITVAWMVLVAEAMHRVPDNASFESMIEASPKLLEKNTLSEFYSDAVLKSEAARSAFVEPDMNPLPGSWRA